MMSKTTLHRFVLVVLITIFIAIVAGDRPLVPYKSPPEGIDRKVIVQGMDNELYLMDRKDTTRQWWNSTHRPNRYGCIERR